MPVCRSTSVRKRLLGAQRRHSGEGCQPPAALTAQKLDMGVTVLFRIRKCRKAAHSAIAVCYQTNFDLHDVGSLMGPAEKWSDFT